jgi:hypothetical protein
MAPRIKLALTRCSLHMCFTKCEGGTLKVGASIIYEPFKSNDSLPVCVRPGKIDDSKYLGVLFGLGQGGLTTPVPWSTE